MILPGKPLNIDDFATKFTTYNDRTSNSRVFCSDVGVAAGPPHPEKTRWTRMSRCHRKIFNFNDAAMKSPHIVLVLVKCSCGNVGVAARPETRLRETHPKHQPPTPLNPHPTAHTPQPTPLTPHPNHTPETPQMETEEQVSSI